MTNDLKKAGRALDGLISRAVQDLVTPGSGTPDVWSDGLEDFKQVRSRTLAATVMISVEQAGFSPSEGKRAIAENADLGLLAELFYRPQIGNRIPMAR